MSRRGVFSWRKNLSISGQDPSYRVRYLGNVQTAMMKGDGCVDRPAATIWNNHQRALHPGLDMKLVLTGSGIKAYTKEQGVTEYRAHRISYCIAHPGYPRLFLWVYRHEGKRMKPELRCHAVLCKSEVKAKAMAWQLHEKLTVALQEFQREKLRKQNSRLVMSRTNSLPQAGSILPLRKQLLSTANNFKPPICKSASAPKLGDIHEDLEKEEEEEEKEEEEEHLEASGHVLEHLHSEPVIAVEMGNDMEQLRHDTDVQFCIHDTSTDSDEDSSESGFHDQDDKVQGVGGGGRGEGSSEVMLSPVVELEADPSS